MQTKIKETFFHHQMLDYKCVKLRVSEAKGQWSYAKRCVAPTPYPGFFSSRIVEDKILSSLAKLEVDRYRESRRAVRRAISSRKWRIWVS